MSKKSSNIPLVQLFYALAVIVAVLGLFFSAPREETAQNPTENSPSRETAYHNMLAAGGNAIWVENQLASKYVVTIESIQVTQPSFVVIYDDQEGMPGRVIGESEPVDSSATGLEVPISQALQSDQVYYALVHQDDGDRLFRPIKDVQALTQDQVVVLMTFSAH